MREGRREGGREGGRERRREGGKDGGREGGKEGEREGGREERRERWIKLNILVLKEVFECETWLTTSTERQPYCRTATKLLCVCFSLSLVGGWRSSPWTP